MTAAQAATDTTRIDPSIRNHVLPSGWQSSADRVVTTDGDASGLHVLVADEKDGYTWRTAATLTEPGTDSDQWIGQSCVTASGQRAVVVYAPRQMVNSDQGFHSGGLAAIVDLTTGAVTKLPIPVSLAYYDPGCGADERAVLTSADGVDSTQHTRLTMVDTAAGKITATVVETGQLSSAVPYAGGIAAARKNTLVSVDNHGAVTQLADVPGVPFRIGADASGGLGYELMGKTSTELRRYAAGRDTAVLSAPNGQVRLEDVGGQVFVQGDQAVRQVGGHSLPAGWRAVDVSTDAQLSTHGVLAVTSATNKEETAGRSTPAPTASTPQPVSIAAQVLSTRSTQNFVVSPNPLRPGEGAALSPALGGAGPPGNRGSSPNAATTDPSTETIDPDRACAIPRNDPHIQSLQPTAKMGEWAADLAVQNALTVARPAGWNGSSLPAYTPQGLFPDHPLAGGGRVPAQVLLGVLSQESNMWQATNHATDGESGNFEQGGFYGNGGDVTTVNFAKADCGYGMAQVTTGMQINVTTPFNATQQLAIAVDYAANVAAGLEILEDKWNQLYQLGMTVNGGDPKYIENWWFALWAYNSGWHDNTGGPYGLGWANNPANEDYPADRRGFLDAGYDDAKTPNHWSYPERVMGWAEHALLRYNYADRKYETAFATGRWPGAVGDDEPPNAASWWEMGDAVVPNYYTFCTAADECDTSKLHKPGDYPTDPGSYCQRDDLECWWHAPADWAGACSLYCGTEVLTFPAGSPEPAVGTTLYSPDCSASELPPDALVIDSVPPDVHTNTSCARAGNDAGTLSFKFASSVNPQGQTIYPSKVDFHQIDSGFNNHFWFAHTWNPNSGNDEFHITGTWILNRTLNQWARVMVYVPDHGAQSHQAWYTVSLGNGTSERRAVVEDRDITVYGSHGSWRDLGVFQFSGTPSVSLDNYTDAPYTSSQQGVLDTDWDSVAFQPLSAKPADFVVSLGDSYASGEGATSSSSWDYYPESDHDGGNWNRDACHRSVNAWSRQARLPDNPTSIGVREDTWDSNLTYYLGACSGARTYNLLPSSAPGGRPTDALGHTATTEYGEASQLDEGYLDANTTLVTLSVGGNDARFADILQHCLVMHLYSPIPCAESTLDGDSAPLGTAEPQVIQNEVAPSVLTVLQQIHRLAPNARIKLMGYPKIITSGVSTCNVEFGSDNIDWFASMAGTLNSELGTVAAQASSSGIPVAFLDPTAAFDGKGACGSPEDINAVVTRMSSGDDPGAPVSQQSFHPNVAGAALYAGVLTAGLANG